VKFSRIQIAGKKSLLLLNGAPVARSPLVWERMILELIALHAPLPSILNTLCTAVDIQIGGIVSLVLLSNEKEQDFHAIALRADDFGLHTFCSAAILSGSNDLLGTLEILCCDPRSPTANEVQIIDRVTQLASIAIHGQPRELLN
jgi:GAF domain-containing protein